MRGLCITLLLGVGCYSPAYQDCEITCPANSCPSGLECNADHVCRPPGATGACPSGSGSDAAGSDAVGRDVPLNGTWSTPVPVSSAIVGGVDSITLTGNQLELYFSRSGDIYQMVRTTLGTMFGNPQPEPNLSTAAASETDPSVSGDGAEMYLISGTSNAIHTSVRTNGVGQWSVPTEINELAFQPAYNPSISEGGVLLFESPNTGFYGTVLSGGVWASPMMISGSTATMHAPMLVGASAKIYYDEASPGFGEELYEANLSVQGVMSGAAPITAINSTMNERDIWISADGLHMYFVRDTAPNEATIFQSDLN